ncbi:MAG: DNA polymerase III subunit epsilon [Pirellulaceae bacterium]|nr:MAG: DNA polymerase III subunit epsilon [Pirellulaceae bacterium]
MTAPYSPQANSALPSGSPKTSPGGLQFVAIDFETACSNPNSACQVAVVVVEEGNIIDRHSWLVRPPRLYFASRNVAIHGITADQVRGAPQFVDVWKELSPILEGRVVVAHFAAFDLKVLVHSLAAYDIACPNLEFSCSRLLARAVWPGKRRYGLKPLGQWLGIDFRHHDALEDAQCCAQIVLAIAAQVSPTDFEDLERRLHLERGLVAGGSIRQPRPKKHRHGRSIAQVPGGSPPPKHSQPSGRRPAAAWHPADILAAAGEHRPLADRRILLLAPLTGLTMEQSVALIRQLGGEFVAHLTDSPDLMILPCSSGGITESCSSAQYDRQPNGPITTSAAAGVRILSERQFRSLLPGGRSVHP